MAVVQNLMSGVTTNTTGSTYERPGYVWSYQASVTGTGAVSVTVTIQVTNDGTNWLTYGTLSPSGTTSATDSITGTAPWANHRAVTSSISGTGATVNVAACRTGE